MNRLLLAALLLFGFAASIRADEPEKNAKDKEPKVYQPSEAELKAFRDERWKAIKKMRIDVYGEYGIKDPKWDDEAIKAMECYARFTENGNRYDFLDDLKIHASNAMKAGCNDPYLRYIQYRYGEKISEKEIGKVIGDISADMEKSKYPESNKILARVRASNFRSLKKDPKSGDLGPPEIVDRFEKNIEQNLKAIAKILKHRDAYPQALACEMFEEIGHQRHFLGMPRDTDYEATAKLLDPIPEAEKAKWFMKGKLYIQLAWDARGTGMADKVTEKGFEDFRERLKIAGEALEKAWDAEPKGVNPLNAKIANEMLTVMKGQSGDREEMEKWFDRAMRADPDNIRACLAKLDYLLPKWHGSKEEAVAFGKACAETRNMDAGLTLILVKAHEGVAECLKDNEEKTKYYQTPEVRKDVIHYMKEYLEAYPKDTCQRMHFVDMAFHVQDFNEAQKQLKIIGDKPSPFFDQERWKEVMKHAKAIEKWQRENHQ